MLKTREPDVIAILKLFKFLMAYCYSTSKLLFA